MNDDDIYNEGGTKIWVICYESFCGDSDSDSDSDSFV